TLRKRDRAEQADGAKKGAAKKGAAKKDGSRPPVEPRERNIFRNGSRRFLSDLPEFDVRSGEWPFRKGDCGNGKQIRVRGVISSHGLGMHPPMSSAGYAAAKYHLHKEAERFKATAAINDTTNWCFSPALFTVLGDGKELWKSGYIAHNHARSQECQVDIKGVDVLELRVQVVNGNSGVHAVVVEAGVLQKADSPDPQTKPEPADTMKNARDIAVDLISLRTRPQASKDLIALGSQVETVVHPYLENNDIFVKYAALDILKVIGTAKSIPAVEKLLSDGNSNVAFTARVT